MPHRAMLTTFLISLLTLANALGAMPSGHIETYPDKALTPGKTDPAVSAATLKTTICRTGYTARVRSVSEETKKALVAGYLRADPEWPKCAPISGKATCEIDHLISLELGGSNEPGNLWPEPYCPLSTAGKTCFGAREKDVVETSLHRRICRGELALDRAQQIITTDWLAEFRKIKGLQQDSR